jgi:hypothetical protein
VLALLLAACSSGSRTASRTPAGAVAQPAAHPHTRLAPAHRRSSASLPARVILPSRTMMAGSSLSGYVLVDNNTGHAVHTYGCGALFQVLLISSHYRTPVAWLTCLQPFVIPVGESRYPAPVRASYSECSQGRPQRGFRPCLPGGRPPPLPPGDYHAVLFQVHDLVRVPPATAVRVTVLGRPHR